MTQNIVSTVGISKGPRLYGRLLLAVASLGGLLYGVDVGIIGGALPYLEATAHLSNAQLSLVVAAVLLGSVLSTLFAGALADLLGRRRLMIFSGVAFLTSVPIIALSQGYLPLLMGRLLQGMSGGFIGVVVPLYLAECLGADVRGKGTGLFQWMLTLGILAAALIGIYYSYRVQTIQQLGDAAALFRFKDLAWRRIFWVSLPPGVLFVIGSFFLGDSPRWLFSKGKEDAALRSLRLSHTEADAQQELRAISHAALDGRVHGATSNISDSLLRRKYVLPFLIACAVLFCNTATGMNSIIGYNTNILLQSGLSDMGAHWGYVIFTALNFLVTVLGIRLVDRKGRKFLLKLGVSGMFCALLATGTLFRAIEAQSVDCRSAVQALVSLDQTLQLTMDRKVLRQLLATSGHPSGAVDVDRASFEIVYSYGGYTNETELYRSTDLSPQAIHIQRSDALPSGTIEALFKSPFSSLAAAGGAPLTIQRALVAPVPDGHHGWLVAMSLFVFVSFFAVGPGICVWLALSELMPTRIRSNGMSIALVLNQLVSTVSAAIFLPVVSHFGYSVMFFLFAGFTALYLLVVLLALPETKGKTLEQIDDMFAKRAVVE